MIDGKNIELNSGIKTLHTKAAKIEKYEMSVWEKILNIISDPNIAYILLLLGMYGIMFELYNPGAILPGMVGVIALILAFYSMHTLPVNYAGLALIIFAIILFLLEIKIVSHGLLAIGGVISLLLGSMMLIRSRFIAGVCQNFPLVLLFRATAVTALFFLFIVGLGIKAQRRKVFTGIGGMVGTTGKSLETLDPVWYSKSAGRNMECRILSRKNRVKEKK